MQAAKQKNSPSHWRQRSEGRLRPSGSNHHWPTAEQRDPNGSTAGGVIIHREPLLSAGWREVVSGVGSGGSRGRPRRHSPFIATPVAADTEVLVDRIWGIALMAAALSCGRGNSRKRGYLPTATSQTTPIPTRQHPLNCARLLTD